MAESVAHAPNQIEVQGTIGSNADRLNGMYKKRKQEVGGRPSYVKISKNADKMVIWFWLAKKVWMMTRKSMINTDSAYACVQDDALQPCEIRSIWKVFDKKAGEHKPNKKITITSCDNSSDIKQNLRKRKEELQRQVEDMKNTMDELEIEIRSNNREIEVLEKDRSELITRGIEVENNYNKMQQEHQKVVDGLAAMIHKVKSIKRQNEDLTQEFQSSKGCTAFDEIQELLEDDHNADLMSQCIVEHMKELPIDEVLSLFSSSEVVCSEIIMEAQNI